MPQHPNFYETVKEADMRLKGTIVLYGDQPYQVMGISNHKGNGIFRIYLMPLPVASRQRIECHPFDNYPTSHPSWGILMDDWIDKNPDKGVLRKEMNSPLFNKYRPFPLGMCNIGDSCYYIERQPTRRTEQGITAQMLDATPVSLGNSPRGGRAISEVMTPYFRACILGEHPTFDEVVANLRKPTITNEAVAFHRNFAVLRGPIDILFLAYKTDVVGSISTDDRSLTLGFKFKHVREAVQDLKVFNSII